MDIDDSVMKGLFARRSVRDAAPAKPAAARKETVLDAKRLHLISIALRSKRLNYESVLAAVRELDRTHVPSGVFDVRRLYPPVAAVARVVSRYGERRWYWLCCQRRMSV